MQYVVRALDSAHEIRTLVLEALDEADARAQALATRHTPLSVAPRGGVLPRRDARFPLLLFAQELLALLEAGLGVVEALDTLVEKDPQPARRAVLARLAQQLREGQRLSGALRQQPDVFPALFAGVVQAAEGTSDLPRALSRYIDYESRLEAVRHKVVSAAIYPAILLVVGTAVALFLLGYVVPEFAVVYQGNGRELPAASQLLMNWGAFASGHGAELLAGVLGALALAGWWIRRNMAGGGWWRALRLLPAARPRIEVLELSRLYLTLGMLLEGGIPLHQALGLCEAVVADDARPGLRAVRGRIEAGEPLSEALAAHGLTTPVALRLLRVGEQSGQLGAMLTRTANFHDQETARWIERFSKALEPVLMAAIGIVVGGIVILLYMPIFDLAGSLQ
ncbi:MAG TPA: type II secretion system F family protein [Ramlibacter sp.]|jgi:general secretion pathway protein F